MKEELFSFDVSSLPTDDLLFMTPEDLISFQTSTDGASAFPSEENYIDELFMQSAEDIMQSQISETSEVIVDQESPDRVPFQLLDPQKALEEFDKHTPLPVYPSMPLPSVELHPSDTFQPVLEMKKTGIDREQAFKTFQQYYSQLEQAATLMSDHMLWCSGKDGHQKTQQVSKESYDQAREQSFINIMNTDIGKKVMQGEEISAAEEKALIEIAAATTDNVLGTKTKQLVDALTEQDISWSDPDIGAAMMRELNNQHIHSADCSHGGGNEVFTSSYGNWGRSSQFGSIDSHEHHNKLVVCAKCSHKMVAHVHGAEGPVCPRCKKTKMKVLSKKVRH